MSDVIQQTMYKCISSKSECFLKVSLSYHSEQIKEILKGFLSGQIDVFTRNAKKEIIIIMGGELQVQLQVNVK